MVELRMERVTVDDLKRMMKITGSPVDEARLQTVASFLTLNMEALQPLVRLGLPKELEPTTYLLRLLEKPSK